MSDAAKVRRVDYHPDEYIVGVSRLPFEWQGVYWMICSLVMSSGGPIPFDSKWIGGLGGMGAAKAKNIIQGLIDAGKITENSGKISQKRAENAVKTAKKRIETAQENGQKGGRPSNKNNDIDKPGGCSDEKANHQPSTKNHKDKDKSLSSDKMTLKQAMEAGDMKFTCIEYAKRKFSEKGWSQIDLELLWEEFAPFWREDRPRTKRADWPRTFYERAKNIRTWKSYQTEQKSDGSSHVTDRHKLVTFISKGIWRPEWGDAPAIDAAKVRLEALGTRNYETH